MKKRALCPLSGVHLTIKPKILTTQLGTSCSFDSSGLARNEPTPGKH
ncbi:hypothetical protein KZY75_12055 [Prevotella salivae]|nr:hypothetical protein [Segatella salivae]